MPPEGVTLQSKSQYLTPVEIERFSRIAVREGITKIRLTGGEPLLRAEIIEIVERLAAISGLEDLALTTNGSHLKKMATSLKRAGLKRINVSLDSLDPIGFKKISLSDSYFDVMEGIWAALSEKFPTKLNMVVMRGVNDHEVPAFIEFALNNSFEEIRFIEFMPLCGTGWKPNLVFPFDELLESIAASYCIEKIHSDEASGVAKSFLVRRGVKSARIGLITTLSEPFCGQCSRIRLSADGQIRPCLFSHAGISIREILRSEASDAAVTSAIIKAIWEKPKGNEFARNKMEGVALEKTLSKLMPLRGDNPSIRNIGG
jgi:cyclic pyranopterin phosphate synthase